MDFHSKLKYQQNLLLSDAYINYVWDKIHGESNEAVDVEQFRNHLPIKFDEFLTECTELLNTNNSAINFSVVEKQYLISLIIIGLEENDMPVESQSVPSRAAILYLAFTTRNVLDSVAFDYIFNIVLQYFKKRLFYNYVISCTTFLCLNKFLQETNQNICKHVNRIIYFLRDCISDSSKVVDNFEIDEEAYNNKNKAILICLKTILETSNTGQNPKVLVTRLSIILLQCANNNANIRESVKHYIKFVLNKYIRKSWCIVLVIMFIQHITSNDFFVCIINEISSTDHYYAVVKSILNYFVKCPDMKLKTVLNVLYGIIEKPHRCTTNEVRETIVKKIMKEIFLKSADDNLKIREDIMAIFIKLFKLRDIHVRRFLQQMFRDDVANRISAKVLFGILETDVDIKWKRTAYNTNFIILTCEMFTTNKEFISAYRLKVITVLCSRTTSFYLKPCIPAIVDIIRRYAVENNPIVRPMLRILVENALKPTTAANYMIKEIFGLISDIMTPATDCEAELVICKIILTDDFDFVNLFKAIESHNLITNKHVQVLFDEKSLKNNPVTWKLLSLLLDLNYTNLFPPYIKYTVESCSTADFYAKPESLYFVQVVCKIFSKKIKQSSLNNDDKSLAVVVEKFFMNHVKLHHVPMKHIDNVLVLLLTLQRITCSSTEWLNSLFYNSFDNVLEQIYSETQAVILQRYLAYMSKIFTLLDFKIDEPYISRLKKIMETENQENIGVCDGMSWGLFITFYGKVCLKNPDMINTSMPQFQFALMHGTPYVQQVTIYTLYDICNLRLSYFDPFEPTLLHLVGSENIDVKSAAIRMLIKLMNDDHIRLNCSDFITFMLVLVDRQLKVSLYFKDVLEKDFIHRNENVVAKYFIHMLLFLNNYKNHPLFPIIDSQAESREYTYERRTIVSKLLYGNLQRHNQFQILNVLCNEVLNSIYTGRMAPTHNVLNIFRDIMNLVLVAALQYLDEEIKINRAFYEKLLESIKKNFFSKKPHNKMVELEFNSVIEHLMTTLLDILYKIERLNKDLLPLLFSVIAITTKAFYDKVVNIVQDSTQLRDLYYEYPNFYNKYKEMIIAEPENLVSWEREEWRLYLDYVQ